MKIINEDIYKIKAELVHKVNSFLKTPVQGLYVILEIEDTSYFKNEIWKSLGISMIKNLGIEEKPPASVLEVQKKTDYVSLIWISAKICNASDIDFAWTYAHECQHLLQHIKYPKWYLWDKKLLRLFNKQGRATILAYESPCEFEAEITAMKITFSIFGKTKVNRFINAKINNKDKRVDVYRYLKDVDLSAEYDLKKEYEKHLGKVLRI